MAVLGVDACKDGWVAVGVDDGGVPQVRCGPIIGALVDAFDALTTVAIDIPIGLPAGGLRTADRLARRQVGPRASSVFSTPPRVALEAETHAEATSLCRSLTGQGLSQQGYALRTKILEVDDWVRTAPVRVVEVHPEVSFAVLAGRFLPDSKSTWAGFEHRRRLLADSGIVLSGDLGLGGCRVGPDDVLDAAVAAWSARRVDMGACIRLPDPPQELGDGISAAIWA